MREGMFVVGVGITCGLFGYMLGLIVGGREKR